jgi:acetyltransferase-like isoleucine patch superfamily enzyme
VALFRRLALAVAHRARPYDDRLRQLLDRGRREWFLSSIQVQAQWNLATVDLHVDPTVRFGRGVRVIVDRGTRSSLRIGAGTRLGDGVLLRLKGGEAIIGDDCDIRRGVNISVGGRLEIAGDNVISWGSIIHCDDDIRIGLHAMLAEYCSLADSAHYYSEPDVAPHRNIRTAPIALGVGVWLCPKATVTSGVTIGDHTIVGSNSAVSKDLPGGQLAGGVPARAVRPLDLPWEADGQGRLEAVRAAEAGGQAEQHR